MKNFICSLLSCMAVFSCLAQQPIVIESKQLALVLETNADNLLCSRYFGPRLQHENEYSHISQEYRMNDGNNSITNSAYTPAGTWNLLEPAIEVKQADGNHSLELKYVSHSSKAESPNVSLTSILLKDPLYPIEVKLQYRVYKNENVIEQWAVISNKGKQPVTLYKYASANLYFTAKKFYLRHYHGEWAREMMPEEELLTAGIKTLDSKLGTRANLFQPPSFALSFDQPGTENEGQVLLGTLAWTGNFRFDFEKDSYDHLRLIAGINPFASQYELGAAKELTTPAFIYSYSAEGIGSASRQMHDWARSYRIPNGNGSRMTLLNNWEATYFDFDENKLTSLFKGAHSLGVDLFLLDDGWFGNKYPRNDDHA
ncbi:MAG TPA: glycoside hydrolase family 36 N-terminal domain-containing protein, partial [Chitinophagaceae bacterium]|nr:glycoside hydrolase family 36 N-terminal domain-containing protein [Chitinophagaceae bacterium]